MSPKASPYISLNIITPVLPVSWEQFKPHVDENFNNFFEEEVDKWIEEDDKRAEWAFHNILGVAGWHGGMLEDLASVSPRSHILKSGCSWKLSLEALIRSCKNTYHVRRSVW